MDAPGLLPAIWNQLLASTPELSWYVVSFAIALPLEAHFGSGEQASWSERCGNAAAMLIHFGVGGLVLQLVLTTPIGQQLAAFPREPRHELLRNSYLWALASVLLVDASYYWYHRLQHAVPLLWRIHALHHTDPAMNVTTSRRTHFLERTLQFFFVNLPMLWILGANLEGSLYATGIMWLILYGAHTDVRLDLGWLTPILVGPRYHRLHHGRSLTTRDTNFAQVFPVFDLLGGTYRRPREDDDTVTGVDGCDTAYARWRPLLW
ncbi:MAG: sterol desaturase family protein [Deltaproteobacteria bacterium]|nr:MAG: sterol desaturase family protein [Deltaproteobacteria bacterium]